MSCWYDIDWVWISFETLLKCKCQAFLCLFLSQISDVVSQQHTPERDHTSLQSSCISIFLQSPSSVCFMSHCSRVFFLENQNVYYLCGKHVRFSFGGFHFNLRITRSCMSWWNSSHVWAHKIFSNNFCFCSWTRLISIKLTTYEKLTFWSHAWWGVIFVLFKYLLKTASLYLS